MEWIETKTMVDIEELKAKLDITDGSKPALTMDDVLDTIKDVVCDTVNETIGDMDLISQWDAEDLANSMREELEAMIDEVETPEDFSERVDPREFRSLSNDLEIARRSIRLLLEERERSLSRRTRNLFLRVYSRSRFTLTLPRRGITALRAKIKEML